MKNKSNKPNFRKTVYTAVLGVVVLFALNCSSPTAAGGSGTGIGNGVLMGRVLHADSSAVKNAVVRLRTEKFLPDTSGKILSVRNDTTVTATTNNDGRFFIESIQKDRSYYIEILDEKQGEYDSGTVYFFKYNPLNNVDTVALGTKIVEQLKDIQGSILLHGLPQNAYVQVYGLERVGRTDSLGRFEIKNLPPGDCENGKCEYELHVLIVQKDGTIVHQDYELEILWNTSGRVIQVELELSDTLDADDFVPSVISSDSTVTLRGFPLKTVITLMDSSKTTVTDSTVKFVFAALPIGLCSNNVCEHPFYAEIPESTGLIQINQYLLRITKSISGVVTKAEVELISHEEDGEVDD
jgi:hypothetical protein